MHAPIRLVDIELACPACDIPGLDGGEAVRGLVRWHGIPLGYLDLPYRQDGWTGAALLAAAQAGYGPSVTRKRIEAWLAPDPDTLQRAGRWPAVTVAVCTRDRPDALAQCLDALALLDGPIQEILVVDNAPTTGATEHIVRERPGVRYVLEPRPGLDWARNRAITEANGEIIAFTDDDVVVDRNWVRALARLFAADPSVAAVTGAVVPLELETEAQLLFERYGGFTPHFERCWYRAGPSGARHHHVGQFGTGANMAFRRSLFDQIGGFNPALDVGTLTHGGGDLEMFFRVLQTGRTLVYEPAAFVRHRHRRTYAQLRAQLAADGMGFMACLVSCAVAFPSERPAIMRTVAWWSGWMLRRFLRPHGVPRDLMLAEWRGAFAGPLRYLQACRVAAALADSTRAGEVTAYGAPERVIL